MNTNIGSNVNGSLSFQNLGESNENSQKDTESGNRINNNETFVNTKNKIEDQGQTINALPNEVLRMILEQLPNATKRRSVERVAHIWTYLVRSLPSEPVFGVSEWKEYSNIEVTDAPMLPDTWQEILDSPDQGEPEKQVRATHLWLLIPKDILRTAMFQELVNKRSTKYEDGHRFRFPYYRDSAPEASYWVLMRKYGDPELKIKTDKELTKKYPGYVYPKHFEVELCAHICGGALSTRLTSYANNYSDQEDIIGINRLFFTVQAKDYYNPDAVISIVPARRFGQ